MNTRTTGPRGSRRLTMSHDFETVRPRSTLLSDRECARDLFQPPQ